MSGRHAEAVRHPVEVTKMISFGTHTAPAPAPGCTEDRLCALSELPPPPPWSGLGQRFCDVALSSFFLVLFAPLVVALLVLVRLTSPGPPLYRQVRLGCGGRRFTIYKIRTMMHDCERHTGPRWSAASDSRVTRVGRVLRQLHLDELPQMWNVLRGDMSLVGPRPERPEIAGPLACVLPGYGGRLAVRPGLTGLAQVQLPPDENLASVARKLALDLDYVREMGPWLDLRILAATALKLAGVPADWRVALLALPTLHDGEPDPFRADIDRVGADVSPQF